MYACVRLATAYYWDFHSLLLGIQMMFSFMLVDGDQPQRLCKH